MKFKPGDLVLFKLSSDSYRYEIGMINNYSSASGNYTLFQMSTTSSAYNRYIEGDLIMHLNDANVSFARANIINHFDEAIISEENKIRKVTAEEKIREFTTKYTELKQRINTVAKGILFAQDDCDFENNLKEICQLKKQLFSIKLECADEIRKRNGEIKYNIKKLRESKKSYLTKISDSLIYTIISNYGYEWEEKNGILTAE